MAPRAFAPRQKTPAPSSLASQRVAQFCLAVCLPFVPHEAVASLGPPASQASVLFERIVAVVDKDVITQGELEAEARLALVMREGERAAFVTLDNDYLTLFTDHLIHQVLVAQEARRMGSGGAPDTEVTARLNQLAEKFAGQAAYGRFVASLTLDAAAVRAIMARDVQNDRYIAERLRTRLLAQSHVTGAPGGSGPALSDAEAQQRALAHWLAELRRAAPVRVRDGRGQLHLERR